MPVTVSSQTGDVSLSVAVRFARGARRSFVIDTGSSQSVVSTSVARSAWLRGTDLAQRQATVCSVITAPLVQSGVWSVPGVVLHPQLLGATNFGSISAGGLDGLLGSDQLLRYGWVVFDYAGGRLVLGLTIRPPSSFVGFPLLQVQDRVTKNDMPCQPIGMYGLNRRLGTARASSSSASCSTEGPVEDQQNQSSKATIDPVARTSLR